MEGPAEYECRGGPLDGERMPDRGWLFLEVARAEIRDSDVVIRPGFQSGVYERQGDTYRWRTD